MTGFLLNISMEKMTQAICWTLVHSLWEGLILTVLTGVAMLFTQKSESSLRYKILLALFLSFVSITTITFFIEWKSVTSLNERLSNATGLISASLLSEFAGKFSAYLSSNASAIVLIWFVIFCWKCVRMMGGLFYTQRIRTHKGVDVSKEWNEKFNSLCAGLQIRRVIKLLQSELVRVPVVIGHFRPIIIIPLGYLANIPASQMEAVIIHELAHIKRNDFITNLLQHLVETVFFFNPGLMWISSLLREERENCCDDIALQITKDRKQFVEALIRFKEYSLSLSSPALAFPGKKNQLFERVSRIIFEKNKSLKVSEKLFSLFSLLVLCILTLFSIAYPSTAPMNMPTKQSATDKKEQGIIMQAGDDYLAAEIKEVKKATGKNQVTKSRHKPIVISYYSKIITLDKSDLPDDVKENPDVDENVVMVNNSISKEQMEKYQADVEREQAIKDREQAEIDRIEAKKDQMEAERNREQAIADRKAAEKDRIQARADQIRSNLDMKQRGSERK
ncbi:MAG: hypothetical protein C5B52_07585 [Bacteroidetes bacterium]|nr:MAG: hypothetical protein C5B52_07585 [Bacteroidota bacterium]